MLLNYGREIEKEPDHLKQADLKKELKEVQSKLDVALDKFKSR